jgi:hypothetical protein
VLDTLLRESPDVARQLEEIVSDVLSGSDTQPLSEEQWMRALFVQQMSGRGDRDVSFYLNDSTACRAFCGIVEHTYIPDEKVSTTLRRMDDGTWQQLATTLRRLMGRRWRKRYWERVDW